MYMFKEESCDVAVQTGIFEGIIIPFPSQKVMKNKKCNTPHKEIINKVVGPNYEFCDDEQLSDLADITRPNFDILLEFMKPTTDKCKISEKIGYLFFKLN